MFIFYRLQVKHIDKSSITLITQKNVIHLEKKTKIIIHKIVRMQASAHLLYYIWFYTLYLITNLYEIYNTAYQLWWVS